MSDNVKLRIKINESKDEYVTAFVMSEFLSKVPNAEQLTFKELLLSDHNIFEYLHNTNGASLIWSNGMLFNINGEFVTGEKREELIRKQSFTNKIEDFLKEE